MSSSGSARTASFTGRDWLLFLGAAVMWGASFLLIKVGVADFAPATVAWLRLLFGAATLALLPGARTRLRHRRDWSLVVVLGLTWMAVPFVLFPVAEQSIDSAMAGMLNAAAPLFTAVIAAVWLRNRPGPITVVGLLVGFAGVVVVTAPSMVVSGSLIGVVLVLAATVFYGVAFNLSEPLEHRNGALPVIFRAQVIALVVSTPAGLIGLGDSTPGWGGMAAVFLLGTVSTGVAFACFVTLVGHVGAARASVTTYLVPVIAIVLGALAASETIHPVSLIGITLVLIGAYLTSRPPRKNRHPGPNQTATHATRLASPSQAGPADRAGSGQNGDAR